MNWALAIEINRKALLVMLAGLFERVGGGETVRRAVHSLVLATLRPVEAAVRRLIAVAAVGMVVPARVARSAPASPIPKGAGKRVPSFALFDRRFRAGPPPPKHPPGRGPGVRGFDSVETDFHEARILSFDDPVPAGAMMLRLRAVRAALEDIPAQARRLTRKLAAMDRPIRPMRPGRPPGHIARGKREIDLLLAECHQLALLALAKVPP